MDLMQAPQKKARPPPQRHVGMNRVSTQWPFLGLVSARFPSAGESRRVFTCRFHPCRHRSLLLVAPASLPAQQEIFSIRSYLHALGTVLGFYPRCAHMQPAKKKLQIPKECRLEQLSLGRRPKMQRRAFLMRASAGVAATAIARPASAQTGAPVRWRLATSWPKSLDTLYGGVEAMCQRVGQMTDRKFQIQCFAGGGNLPPPQTLDATPNTPPQG